jgi:hypothetical protein
VETDAEKNKKIENENEIKKQEQHDIENDVPIFKETKVGTLLSELTTRRVIILVMSIMFSIPIFAVETYFDNVVSYDIGLSYT